MMAVLLAAVAGVSTPWIRAGINVNRPLWGIEGHLQFAVHPAGIDPKSEGGPRGLIRVGYPILPNGEMSLINFIAIEPTVKGQTGRSFSELEPSKLDAKSGKRIWAAPDSPEPRTSLKLEPGTLRTLSSGAEELSVVLRVERFDAGAHVRVVASMRSDRPDELRLQAYQEKDSLPIERCILTATMGNFMRARQLWLKDGPVRSLDLWPDHKRSDFTDHATYGIDKLFRTQDGDVLVAITTNEKDPSAVHPFEGTDHWYYGGFPLTQYWRKPKGDFTNQLQVKVNGRYTYWMSDHPLPGGIAYENFEMGEPFRNGSAFVFGLTRRTPKALGLPTGG